MEKRNTLEGRNQNNDSRLSFPKRILAIFVFQSLFFGVALMMLNLSHGKYDLTLRFNDIPWWQLFLCFGSANLCAGIACDRVGLGNRV
ncbi:unnamed protein product [Aureobasidium pullulans]|nr:unnamed protein product [Aureobasidium pullulans]